MTDVQKSRREWAGELESYGAEYDREAPVRNDGVLNEVWKVTRTGQTLAFLVPYVLEDDERLATQATIDRRIADILDTDADAPKQPLRVPPSRRGPGETEAG